MKTLFLTSIASFVIFDIVKKLNVSSKNNKLVFVTTPAEVEEGDKQWLEDDRLALGEAGFDVLVYTITDKQENSIRKDLSKFDYICVSGGNTFYFLEKSRQSGFINVIRDFVLKEGKVYIGSSAGSVVAGPDIYPAYNLDDTTKAPNLTDYKGFSLIDFVTLPHWGSERFKNLYMNKRLEVVYNTDNKIILLTDNQYVYVKDDWYKIIESK